RAPQSPAPHGRPPPQLGLRRRTLAAAAALAQGLPARVYFGAGAAIAADAREVAARRLVHARALERVLQGAHLGLHLADALEILVLAERRLDPLAQQFGRRAGAEQQRDGAIAELELALDGLGRAVHHAQQVLEAVARVERDHALAFGVDAAPARAARHLGQLVVHERAEAAVGALGHALQHDGARRHVDAE